jgi:symplekin
LSGVSITDGDLATVDDVAPARLPSIDFKLPPPKELAEDDCAHLLQGSVSRVWNGAEEPKSGRDPVESPQAGGSGTMEMWIAVGSDGHASDGDAA